MDTQNPQGEISMAGTFHQQCTTPEIRGHLCLDCARQGLTCCQEHDIYVTAGDCQRIRRHTRSLDFFEYRGCSHAAYADQEDDPLWRQYVFRDNGSSNGWPAATAIFWARQGARCR